MDALSAIEGIGKPEALSWEAPRASTWVVLWLFLPSCLAAGPVPDHEPFKSGPDGA